MKQRLNVVWNEDYCKRCIICVEVCPVQVLSLERDEIMEKEGCIRCYQCVRSAVVDYTSIRCPVNPELGFERFCSEYLPRPRARG